MFREVALADDARARLRRAERLEASLHHCLDHAERRDVGVLRTHRVIRAFGECGRCASRDFLEGERSLVAVDEAAHCVPLFCADLERRGCGAQL